MKKITISFRFTGENLETLKHELLEIEKILKEKGYKTYCPIWHEEEFQKNKLTSREILETFLKEIASTDFHMCYIRNNKKSEGMLIETGYALAKAKPLIIVTPRSVKTVFLHELATHLIKYETKEDLHTKLLKIIL